MAGDWIEVTPPSTSLAPTAEPADRPVTMQKVPPASHGSSCMAAPPELVPCGVPRCQRPVVAVSVPAGFKTHPRLAVKSSENRVLLVTAWNVAVYNTATFQAVTS